MFYQKKLRTTKKEEIIDVTEIINNVVYNSGVLSGIAFVYIPHTTCAITINENSDPAVKIDIIKSLSNLGIESTVFTHIEGNSPAHVKTSLIGSSVSVFINDRRLLLGRWQGIMLAEFDGPREREIWIKILRN